MWGTGAWGSGLEVARAAPGMATLLPRGLTELLGFVRRLSAFTLDGVGDKSPHLSQLRTALRGLEAAEETLKARPPPRVSHTPDVIYLRKLRKKYTQQVKLRTLSCKLS